MMRILVTAGGTQEPIDAVRVLSNVSTGSLGRALCVEAVRRGHAVLLLAPVELPKLAGPLPRAIEHRPFRTTIDLETELRRAARERSWDVVFHAAAVSDYRPATFHPGKRPSDSEEWVLRLVRTPKLIARLREWFGRALLVGFKLSSGMDLDSRMRLAREQIEKNRTDLCVENNLAEFGPGEHQARIVTKSGEVFPIAKASKASVARSLLGFIEQTYKSMYEPPILGAVSSPKIRIRSSHFRRPTSSSSPSAKTASTLRNNPDARLDPSESQYDPRGPTHASSMRLLGFLEYG